MTAVATVAGGGRATTTLPPICARACSTVTHLTATAIGSGISTATIAPAFEKTGRAGRSISRLDLSYRADRSEEHTSELQSLRHLVCRLLLEKKKKKKTT